MPSQKLLDRLAQAEAEKLAKQEAEAAAARAEGSVTDSSDPLAQFVPTDEQTRSDEDAEMDRVMERIDILTAYRKWCGKSQPQPRQGQRDSIKVSCPWPGHQDDHASASLNVDKDVFMCHGTCEKGGDKYDLAAIRFGFDLHTYKQGENFHKLRRAMAESMGYSFARVPGKKEYTVVEPEKLDDEPDLVDEVLEPVAEDTAPVSAPLATVSIITDDYVDDIEEDLALLRDAKVVDQKAFCKPNTFLDSWRIATSIDDAPEDYHFWHAMIALGLAAGHNICLADRQSTVYGNLFVCLLGHTGVGKSRSKRHLVQLWSETNTILRGYEDHIAPKQVKLLDGVGSGEMMVKSFSHAYAPDPTNPKQLEPCSIRGLVEFGELNQLNKIVSRLGNTLEPILQKLYDAQGDISSSSLTTGEKHAFRPFGSLLTTTQPKRLRHLMGQAQMDSGFANRFIFATGRPKPVDEFTGPYVDLSKPISAYTAVKMWCNDLPDRPHTIHLTNESKIYARDLWREKIYPVTEKDESGLLSRLSVTMKKMILLLAINEMEEQVTEEMIDRAFTLLPYIINSYGISGRHIGESKSQEIERAILEAIELENKKSPGKGATLRDITRRLARRKYETKDINSALKEMQTLGLLDKIESQRGPGRPTIRYKIAG